MPYILLCLMLMLVFGKVRALQSAFGFGGEVVNTPPKVLLLAILFGCILKAIRGEGSLHFSKTEKAMLLFFILFIVSGVLSSIFSDYHVGTYPQIMDVFNYSSFILAFYGTIYCFQNKSAEEIQSWLKPSVTFTKVLTLATFVFWFIEQTFGIGMTSHDISNRLLPPYEFIYYHGTFLITVVAFSFLLLYDKSRLYLFILCFLCVVSARDRGYLFLMLFLSLSLLVKYNKLNFKFLFPILIIIGICGAAISFEKILFYSDADSIRATFYVTAALLAIKFFPFGAGWCTIGTWNAYRYDSPVFTDFYYYFGWSEEKDSVYGDSGFSSIIGQTGLCGTICYSIFLILLFFVIMQRFNGNQKLRMIACAWILFQIISFFVSDSMVSNFSIISAFFMGTLYLLNSKQVEADKITDKSEEEKKESGDDSASRSMNKED